MNLDDAKNAVKTGWKLLVDELGGVDATASACGVSRSLVSEYGNRNGKRFAPAHTILAGERVAGTPHVTSAMARALGYELVLVEGPRAQTELIVRVVVEASPGLASLLERLCAGGQRESAALPQPTPKAVEATEVKKPSALLGKMTPERKQLIANMRAGGCGWGEIFTAVNELPGGKFSTPNTLSGWALKLIKTGAIPTPNENVVVPHCADHAHVAYGHAKVRS